MTIVSLFAPQREGSRGSTDRKQAKNAYLKADKKSEKL